MAGIGKPRHWSFLLVGGAVVWIEEVVVVGVEVVVIGGEKGGVDGGEGEIGGGREETGRMTDGLEVKKMIGRVRTG